MVGSTREPASGVGHWQGAMDRVSILGLEEETAWVWSNVAVPLEAEALGVW